MFRIYSVLVLLILVSCDSKEVKRDRFFLQGNVALDEREFEQAITHFTNAITVDPDFAMAYNNRGVAKAEQNRHFEAIQDYNQALLIDGYYWDALANRANAYESTKQYGKSLSDVEQLRSQFPDSLHFQFVRGLVLTHLDSLEAAAEAFDNVWKNDGSNIEALINLANVRFYQQRYDESIRLLEEAIEIDPFQDNAFNTLNQVFNEVKKFEQALQAVNKALEIAPNFPLYLNNRGYTYLMLDSLDQAISDINASLVRDPENMWAFRNKGIYFYKKGDLEQAKRYLQQAVDAKQYVPESRLFLAEILESENEDEMAGKLRSAEKPGHHH